MLRIGDEPVEFTLPKYGGGNFTLSEATFVNKVTLLSFLDINNAWDWLHHLVNLRALFTVVDVQIIAVIFDHTGFVDSGSIDFKFPDPNLTPPDLMNADLPVCMDGSWATSFAAQYGAGFDAGNDSSFHSNAGQAMWTYIISESYYITDKWNLNCTTLVNQDPISFRRFEVTPGVPFDSQDFANTESYVQARLTNLLAAPTIMSAVPVEGSTINTLPRVEIVFSKPVGDLIPAPPDEVLLDIADVKNTANYAFTGGGATAPATLAFAAVDPLLYENNGLPTVSIDNVGKIENAVTLTLTGTLTNDNADNLVNIALSSITDTAGNPLTDNTVTYNADVSGPVLNPVTIASNNAAPAFAKIGDTVTVSFTSDENLQTPTVTIAGQPATVTGGPTAWTAEYTMQASDTEGAVGFVISAIQDTLGNPSGNVTGVTDDSSVTFSKTDLINPVASITSDISGTTDTSPIPVTITFSKEVVGFDLTDITTNNCTVTNFIEVTSQKVWTADIVPNSQGELSLYIDKDVVQDTSGNNNFKSQTLYITYTGPAIDIDAPRVLSVKINPHLDQ